MSSDNDSVVAVFRAHNDVDNAVEELAREGFDMKKLSVVGKAYYSDEQVLGFYNAADRVTFWGKLGAFWGGLSGLLFSTAFLAVPVFGHLVVLGPLASMFLSTLSGAAVTGGLSALGAALYSIGIPKDSIVKYEAQIRGNKFLLLYHGAPDEARRARDILESLGAESLEIHAASAIWA